MKIKSKLCWFVSQCSSLKFLFSELVSNNPLNHRLHWSALDDGSARSIIPHHCWEKTMRHFGICAGWSVQWTPWVQMSELSHASVCHLPPWCHHSCRCSAPSRGLWGAAPWQKGNVLHPQHPHPRVVAAVLCLVLLVRGLSWVGEEQLLPAFGWGVGLCMNLHYPELRGVDPFPGHIEAAWTLCYTVVTCLSFTDSKMFLGVFAFVWLYFHNGLVERYGSMGCPGVTNVQKWSARSHPQPGDTRRVAGAWGGSWGYHWDATV